MKIFREIIIKEADNLNLKGLTRQIFYILGFFACIYGSVVGFVIGNIKLYLARRGDKNR